MVIHCTYLLILSYACTRSMVSCLYSITSCLWEHNNNAMKFMMIDTIYTVHCWDVFNIHACFIWSYGSLNSSLKVFLLSKKCYSSFKFYKWNEEKGQFCLDIRLTYRAGIGFSLYKKRINFRSSSWFHATHNKLSVCCA